MRWTDSRNVNESLVVSLRCTRTDSDVGHLDDLPPFPLFVPYPANR